LQRAFGLAEAKALIKRHCAAVLALMVHRTLNAEQIDNVISSAPEFARRVYWNSVLESAAVFAAAAQSVRYRL
jgi:hypothetical protein